LKYNFDKYGNVIAEVEEENDFDYYYEIDPFADETPRWGEMSYNRIPMKTDWWSNDTFQSEVEEVPLREEEEF